MALQQTVWAKFIMAQVFANNEFLYESRDWNEYVNKGIKTVTIPQAGLPAGYERNRSSLPATITQRTDSDVTYDMVDYTSNPRLVTELDRIQLSYDKMESEVEQMLENIKEGVAEDILYAWRPALAASIIKTTGATDVSTLPGTTGNRKAITYKDITKAAEHLNRLNAPKKGRVLLLPSGLYTQALNDSDVKNNFNQKLADLETGFLGTLCGFKIYDRSSALLVSNSDVIKTPGASVAVTDSEAAMYWVKNWVGKSVGNIAMYADDKPRPEYFGKVASAQLQAGGRKAYSDGRGVGMIVPTTV